MAKARLALALDQMETPVSGLIAVFGATTESDLSALLAARVQIISPFATVHAAFSHLECREVAEGPFEMAIVIVPRAKAQARDLIAQAVSACPTGLIVVDGQKTDGVEPLFKACRARAEIEGQITKAHGRAFWFQSSDAFDDWRSDFASVDGYATIAGVFSADGIDPASALLAEHLPSKPGAHVADFGAGWGFLASKALANPKIAALHLVENDANALACARRNVTDPRAQFHWGDVIGWKPSEKLDTVIMNPPFHQGRKGAPELGQAFIATAARVLKPSGQVVLVANRHLPYDATLATYFTKTTEIARTGAFKVLHAERPTRR